MKDWTRRDLLKMGVAAPAAAAVAISGTDISEVGDQQASSTPASSSAQKAVGDIVPRREKLLLDFGWRFHLGDADDAKKDFDFGAASSFAKSGRLFAASRAAFDDSKWREIDLPHDWAVELPFVDGAQLPEDERRDLISHGCKPLGRAFPATSIGWYRRVFEIPEGDAGRRISIEFDGVYRDAIAVLNGHYLGRNFSGYAPARYDVTDFLNYGGKNYLVVRVDATENEGWFYEGAGIYRHVWLEKTHPIHVVHGSDFAASDVRGDRAIVLTAVEIANETDAAQSCSVAFAIQDAQENTKAGADGTPITLPARSRKIFEHELVVLSPALWSLESPAMYTLTTTIEAGGKEIERHVTPFGIRSIRFNANEGFFLNGKQVPIRGTCNHQDHAGVGAALPDGLQSYRVQRLKEMGCNAYRTSHNPPTKELLNACDRLGMLVMDETRMMDASPEALSQLERMVRRDRNHPSVILWSIGNEEPEQGTERGARIAATMKQRILELDATRPITEAMNGSWGKGLSAVVDVQGFNYEKIGERGGLTVDKFHAAFPAKPCVGSEEASTFCTRGIYENDKARGYMSAYDVNAPSYGTVSEEWVRFFAARPWLAGAFVWTGFDYRGEPSPYAWPCISSHFGIMDTCGFPKDNFYYYQAWWTERPVLHIFPHWNWRGKEGKEISVWAHSNCDEVELLLNEKSLGRKPMTRLSHLEWKVPFAPGALAARGYKNGKVIAQARVETTESPAQIKLVADRSEIIADGRDVSVFTVSVHDVQGRLVPDAGTEIFFEMSGPGRIIGVGNGDPGDHSADRPDAPYRKASRHVFGGLAQVIVQSTTDAGEIQLTTSSAGLKNGSLTIRATHNSSTGPQRP